MYENVDEYVIFDRNNKEMVSKLDYQYLLLPKAQTFDKRV